MKNKWTDCLFVVLGIALLVVGVYFTRNIEDPSQWMKILPYVSIGIGSVIFGHGMGNIIQNQAVKKDPKLQKQMSIDRHDERNVKISNMAKAKANDLMSFVFPALLIAFALMGIELSALLLLVFAYLFIQGYGIYYRAKFEREM